MRRTASVKSAKRRPTASGEADILDYFFLICPKTSLDNAMLSALSPLNAIVYGLIELGIGTRHGE